MRPTPEVVPESTTALGMVPSITPNWMSSSVSHAFSAFSIFSFNTFSKRLISVSNSSSCASNCSAMLTLTVSTLSRWIALVLVAAVHAAFLLLYFLGSCWCLDTGAPFSSFLKLTFFLFLLARSLVATCPRACDRTPQIVRLLFDLARRRNRGTQLTLDKISSF